MAIKLIAADLDGTLLQNDHCTVAKEEQNAIAEAVKQGVIPVIASGRTWEILQNVVEQVNGIQYAIFSNGAAWYRISDGVYSLIGGMPYPLWQPCYQVLKENGAVFEVYHRGKSYLEQADLPRFVSPHLSERFRTELIQNITLVENVETVLRNEEIEKISVLTVPQQNCETVMNYLEKDGRFTITTSIPGNIEINAKGIDKGAALKRLCGELGIGEKEVMAFGDSNNDSAMLRWAYYSFAMENAVEEARKAARFLTKSNEAHGVSEAIRQYVLPVPR